VTRRRRAPEPGGDLVLFSSEQFEALLAGPDGLPTPTAPEPVPEVPASRAPGQGRRSTRARRAAAGSATDGAAASLDPRVYERPVEETIPGASPASAVSVATLTQTTKDVLEGAFVPLWVRGEVSDFKAHRNGHWYFALRDDQAQIKCVMWARDQRRMIAAPDDGMQVVALGQLTVFPGRGELQFSVKAMDAEGDGLWRKALDQTLRRLHAEGLLDPARKRPIPRFPRRIAVVTSPDGAALHDIVSVIRRRCGTVEIVIVPAKVQGDGAPDELCGAFGRVARWLDEAGSPAPIDALIVGRGGGAREDLWAFNDERVARAVATCRVPTISAVGHEVDLTLCDLVADLRAATPSAAAEAAVPVLVDARAEVRALGGALAAAARRAVERRRETVAGAGRELAAGARQFTERRRASVEQAAARLHALSPLATLGRGYAVARSADGEALSAVRHFGVGMPFNLLLHDGAVRAVAQATQRGAPLDAAARLRRVDDE
jgi:exodeoxyribonuclease VII large subunit